MPSRLLTWAGYAGPSFRPRLKWTCATLLTSPPTQYQNTYRSHHHDQLSTIARTPLCSILQIGSGERFKLKRDRRPHHFGKSNVSTHNLYVITRKQILTSKCLISLDFARPSRRLSDLVPAEQTAHPTFKIMRRAAAQDRVRAKASSGDSITGEDDLSDPEPSEAGSLGGRSNATGSSSAHTKKRMTIAEREAAYNEARSRIFMDFEEKEKEKERGMSASSSTLSLASASTSAGGGGSSLGDIDDGRSTAATESEWSAPITRDGKRDSGSGHNSVAGPSSRSLRSTAPPFNASGSGSARGSRAASPSFTFPSLYEASSSTSFDAAQAAQAPPPGYIAHYIYQPYPPPTGQMPGQPYIAPYGYYPPTYPYPYPQPPPTGVPVPAGTPGGDNSMMPQHQQHLQPQHPDAQQGAAAYMNPYMWTPPHLAASPPGPGTGVQNQAPQPQRHPSTHNSAPPQHTHVPQYAYVPPGMPYAPYGMQGYYPPQPGPGQLMHVQNQTQSLPVLQQNGGMNGSGGAANANSSMNGSAHQSRRNSNASQGTSHGSPNLGNGVIGPGGGGKRGLQPGRSPWSYGPGIGGFGQGGVGGMGGEPAVGPRLSSSMRRTSNTSSGGGSTGNRTPGDEASSTAVSQNFISLVSSSQLSRVPDFFRRFNFFSHLQQDRPHRGGHLHLRLQSIHCPLDLTGQWD